MPASLDWMWYLAAALLGALGLWLMYWSLLRDRARGRRRCPKCWYDMSATPSLTCSECGYVARRERKLFKTRRRWRWAIAATIIVLLASTASLTPRVQQHGVESIIPTTVLILAMPLLPSPPPPANPWFAAGPLGPPRLSINDRLRQELDRRLLKADLYDWQWKWAFRHATRNSLPWTLQLHSRERWPIDAEIWYSVMCDRISQLPGWLSYDRLRFIVQPTTGGDEIILSARPSLHDWRARTASLGALAPGLHRIAFNVRAEHAFPSPSGEPRWVELWNDRHSLTFEVAGSADQFIEPSYSDAVAQALQERLWCAVLPSALRVVRAFPELDSLPRDTALGLSFELLCDGQVIARTAGWWGNNGAPRVSEHLPWEFGSFPAGACAGSLELRVNGRTDLALRAFDDRADGSAPHSSCWIGELVIPLQVPKGATYAIPTHGDLNWAAWAGRGNANQTMRD